MCMDTHNVVYEMMFIHIVLCSICSYVLYLEYFFPQYKCIPQHNSDNNNNNIFKCPDKYYTALKNEINRKSNFSLLSICHAI